MSNAPKILIVDDDPFVRDILQELLRAYGYITHTASSGEEAIECVNKDDFDLILLDMVMPDINGFQVMDHMLSQDRETLIIIITGYASTESAIEALRRGAYYYISKPIKREELLRMVKNALDQKKLKTDKKRAEEALKKAHHDLEKLVKKRTEELEKANEKLKREVEERKQAEEALRESEEKYRNILGSIEDGYYEVDLAGNFTLLNDSFCRIVGYSEDELMGANYKRFTDQDDSEKVYSVFNKVYTSGKPVKGLEWDIIRKEGKKGHIELSISLMRDSEGHPIGFRGIIRDIAERKRAQEVLLKSQERFKQVVENAQEWIWEVDAEGRYTYASPVVEAILGYEPEEIVGKKHFYELFHPEDREELKNGAFEVFAQKQPFREFINRNVHKSGRIVWLSTSGVPLLDKKGDLLGYRGADTDITERKRAEDALRESEEKYRFLTENIVDIVWTIDRDFRVTYVSPTIEKVLGFTPEERKRQTLEEMITPESVQKVQERFLEELQIDEEGGADPDRPVTIEVEYYRKDGSTIWMENRVKAIRDSAGAIVGIHGVSHDITERKRAEEERLRFEARIRQAQKIEAIGTLAGGIAHDFNNILGIIVGNTELAIEDVPEWNPAKENLLEVRKACVRAKDMVRQILSFSRQTEAERIPVGVKMIIEESLKMLRASIPTTIDIRSNLTCEQDTVLGDSTQINQVFMNLCTNARDAMREEGGTLEVTLEETEVKGVMVKEFQDLTPGRYVRLAVSDTGHGITPDMMDRIFDPYFTTKEASQGTGMGLAVVHGIVKNHNGAVRVESKLGKGTVFEVLLPYFEAEAEPESDKADALPRGKEQILFVDDEESLVNMTKRMLERLGYRVVAKTSPIDALETFRSESGEFDLVLTDMTMPQMTGERLARELMEIRPDIPIIISTGFSEQMDEDKANQMGIKAYMMKPLVMRKLAHTVRDVLDKK